MKCLKREVEIRDAETKPLLNPLKEAVRKLTTSPKIKVFLWKILCNAIPAGELLIKRSIKMDQVCNTCGHQENQLITLSSHVDKC